MSITRAKVEMRGISEHDRDKSLKILLSLFNKEVKESKVLSIWKEKQFFESKSRKKRRLKRENKLHNDKELREKLRTHFNRSGN